MFALIVSSVLWLIPHLAAASSIGNRMIKARAETQRKSRPFKLLLDPRRCIILADGFYEWRKEEGGWCHYSSPLDP